MSTTLDLDMLEALDRAATAGPWYLRAMDDDRCVSAVAIGTQPNTSGDSDDLCDSGFHGIVAATLIQHHDYVVPADGRYDENARLIVALRNALPELLRLARLGTQAERCGGQDRQ